VFGVVQAVFDFGHMGFILRLTKKSVYKLSHPEPVTRSGGLMVTFASILHYKDFSMHNSPTISSREGDGIFYNRFVFYEPIHQPLTRALKQLAHSIAAVSGKRLIAAFFYVVFISTSFNGSSQIPPGYYNGTAGMDGEDLKLALHNIIRNHTVRSYNILWDDFFRIDKKPNGLVWDIYSDRPFPESPPYDFEFFKDQCPGGIQLEGGCYNREHTFPRSWWGGGTLVSDTMNTDRMQIFPVDSWVNAHRSNLPYGIVDGQATTFNGSKRGPNAYDFPGETFTGTVFEPIDEYKGDLARVYFYMVTRYLSRTGSWSELTPVLENGDLAPWAAAMFLEWHLNDPVSEKETARNDTIFILQGNRNPFVDYPEFASLIWGGATSGDTLSHVNNFSATTITLTWNDASGPTPPHGYLIIMSDSGFDAIAEPANGEIPENSFWSRHVAYGTQKAVFGELTPGVVYYFRIFSYRRAGQQLTFKTDNAPQLSIMAR
jgi:endonuclease I